MYIKEIQVSPKKNLRHNLNIDQIVDNRRKLIKLVGIVNWGNCLVFELLLGD